MTTIPQLLSEQWESGTANPAKPLQFSLPRLDVASREQVTVVQNIITGGRSVPPDKDWTATVFAAGTGLVEWRCINGTVQFRGSLKQTISAAGSHTVVRQFTKGTEAYWPTTDLNFTVYAIDTGVQYRIGLVRITTTGAVSLAAPTGKYDGVEFGGIEYTVF